MLDALIVGVGFALFFGVLSYLARRWWPLAYIATLFFGLGAGLELDFEVPWLANLWWLAWVAYLLGWPIYRLRRTRPV